MPKHVKTKLVSLILTSCILSSNILIPAHATQSGIDINAGGNNSESNTTARGGDFGCNSPNGRIGIRVSVVDKNDPSKVISVNNEGEPRVLDILFINSGQNGEEGTFNYYANSGYKTKLENENVLTAVKTQNFREQNKPGLLFIDELAAATYPDDYEIEELRGKLMYPLKTDINGVDWPVTQWMYYNNTGKYYYSTGEEFLNWCWSDSDGNQVMSGFDGDIFKYSTTDRFGNVTDVQLVKKGDGGIYINTYTTASTNGTSNASVKMVLNSREDIYNYIQRLLNDEASLGPTMIAKTSSLNSAIAATKYLYETNPSNFTSEGDYKYCIETLEKKLSELGNTSSDLASSKNPFSLMQVNALTDENIKDNDLAEEGNSKKQLNQQSNLAKLFYIGDTSGHKLLQTQEMLDDPTLSFDKLNKDWVLMIEPIVYLTIFQTGDEGKVLHSKVYGTITNVADKLIADGVTQTRTFNYKALNEVAWSALHIGDNDFKFNNGLTISKLGTKGRAVGGQFASFAQLSSWHNPQPIDGTQESEIYGYGINIYSKDAIFGGGTKSYIDTWDKGEYPDAQPGPSPDASSTTEYPEETDFGADSKKCNIVKFYYIDTGDGSTEALVDVKTRKDTPHKVFIENEGTFLDPNKPEYFWEVQKWATGKEAKIPETGDLSKNYEEWCKSNPGTVYGDSPALLEIDPADGDKVVYVKLRMQQVEKSSINIVKVFTEEGKQDIIQSSTEQKVNPYVVPEESGWTYESSIPSSNNPQTIVSWNDIKGETPTTSATIPTEGVNTIYIHYVKGQTNGETAIVPLYQNEISKRLSLSSILDSKMLTVTNTIPRVPSNNTSSNGEPRWRYRAAQLGGSNGWRVFYNYENPNLTNADSQVVAKPAPFETTYTGLSATKSANQSSQGTLKQNFNSTFTVWRGYDKPTLAAYKSEDSTNNLKSELITLGIPEGNTPQSARAASGEQGTISKVFNSQFVVGLSSDTQVDSDRQEKYKDRWHSHRGGGGCWKWGNWHSWYYDGYIDSTRLSTAPSAITLKMYTYLGKPNTGDKQSSDNNSLEFKIPTKTMGGGTEERVFSGKGTAIQTSQAITLYPYTQMKYNTTQNSAWKNVYTLSNYLSTIHNTDFVDLAYSKKNTNSLELNSTQWSTHSRSIKAVGKDNALPGGALHNLSTPDENNTQVALRIFQTVTPDTIQPALQSGYDYYNSNAAQARRDELINQVTESLSNLSVVQYINEGITKDLKQLIGGVMVQSSGNQQVFKNTTSTDSKYFFKFAKTQADGGAINIKKSDDITEIIYSITSFTNGDVKVYKNGAEMLGISKTEDINKILSNPELKELDDKTKFFTNFILAIDRNVGSDGSGQKWYNEAIDSLELHVYTQIFTLGFAEPFSTRSSVLDPKLIGQQESKSDLYNYEDNSKVRSSVYLTYSKPTNQTQDGVFATWGENNTAIILPRLPYLFQSKIFYIPNATVQDLN